MNRKYDRLFKQDQVERIPITVCTVEEAAEALQMTILEVRKVEAQALRKLRRELLIRGLGFDDLYVGRMK